MDVKEADGSYDKDSDKLRRAIENNLFGLSQDLKKQYISILESFEPVVITDESAVQHELDHHDKLAEAILNSHIELRSRHYQGTCRHEFYRVESYGIKVSEFRCDRHRSIFN